MSMQINKSAYEKLIKEDIEWLLSNTKDSLERRHIVEVLNYSPERLYASGSSEIPNDLEEAARKEYPCDKSWMTPDMLDLNAHKQVAFRKGAEWQKEQDTRDMYMSDNRHFEKVYQLGRTDMREQMLKEAVEGCVTMYANKTYPTLIGIRERIGNTGDKVKLIIVKEDK